MEIIYSSTVIRDTRGIKAVNPAFFIAPEHGVLTVYLNGDYPKIKAAYEQVGVTVLPLSQMQHPQPKAEPVAEGETRKKGKR